ncbi:hypothetical protein JCM19232_5670 [Vibrio ishigakensis]|uniref:Uncharacterized protein n=1 Tax=Vibrio ishigakensis TaxID=1481914 RepID=A0A0B8PEX3_9VIBR|nr:hypothetical protein JCM19232_5670 [Vibrio ishigakensis]
MDVDECPSGAWEQIGQDMTMDEVLAQIAKDDVFLIPQTVALLCRVEKC